MLRLFPFAVQRYILLIPFKGINPGNVIPNAAILQKAGRCQTEWDETPRQKGELTISVSEDSHTFNVKAITAEDIE